MLTKKEYAMSIIKERCRKSKLQSELKKCGILYSNDISALDRRILEELIDDIFNNSSLAVALDVFGCLDDRPELKEYASSRDGIIAMNAYIDNHKEMVCNTLSVRELIDILPADSSFKDKPYKVTMKNGDVDYLWAESLKSLFENKQFQLYRLHGINFIEDDIVEVPIRYKRVIYSEFDNDPSPRILDRRTVFYKKIIDGIEMRRHIFLKGTDSGKIVVTIGKDMRELQYKITECNIEVFNL